MRSCALSTHSWKLSASALEIPGLPRTVRFSSTLACLTLVSAGAPETGLGASVGVLGFEGVSGAAGAFSASSNIACLVGATAAARPGRLPTSSKNRCCAEVNRLKTSIIRSNSVFGSLRSTTHAA